MPFQRNKESRGFFSVISKKFSQASKWHFENNPTRKIKTSHLRVNSSNTLLNAEVYSHILNEQAERDAAELSPEELLSQSIRIDENNIYGFVNTLKLDSKVLSFSNEYQEPAKFLNTLNTVKNQARSSFSKIRSQLARDKLIYSVKDKPVYKQP